MSKKDLALQVLLNEYKYISELRERSIKNIENSTNTYLVVLGACLSSFSIFNNGFNSSNFSNLVQYIPIGVLVIFQIVGYFIYKNMVLTHTNFINYTRYLNSTRNSLIENGYIEAKSIFLQVNRRGEEEPLYDNLGFSKKMKFSKDGMLRVVQIVNSLR